MSPESLTVITSANAKLSRFLHHASEYSSTHANQTNMLSRIESELPAITLIIEEAGRAIGSSELSKNIDEVARSQIDRYARNLRELKALLLPVLASAQAKRQHLAENTQKVHEIQSWLGTLTLTKME